MASPGHEFLHPPSLFDEAGPGETLDWTCLRVRARAEKKFAQWLRGRNVPCFLPTYEHETCSHRKRRVSILPLIPGYLFAQGRFEKKDIMDSGLLLSILLPQSPAERARLHMQLWNLWKSLREGSRLELVEPLQPGEEIRITSGTLSGMHGRFQKWGENGRLVVNVELIGVAVATEIPESCAFRSL